jgi:hypothetical protein
VYQLRPGVLPYAARLSKPLPEGIRDDIKVWLNEGELKAEMSVRAQDWIDTHGADFIGRPDRILSFLFSALRIMREPVAVVERHGLPANMRKRVSTRKLRNLHVTVIEYRRPASHPQAGTTWTLSHRYYRRAHKRRVWYKDPDTGERKQRVVHIPSTICGDPSLPLMLREHVNALTR